MIDLRRKLMVMYVMKRIMKFKYKNRKKRALFLSVNSIKTYLQRKQVFASMIRSTLFEMNIRRRCSVWVYQIEELWFDSMLTDQNFEQHWRSDFRMSRDTFQDIVRVVQPALKKRDTQFRRAISIEKRVAIALWKYSTGIHLLFIFPEAEEKQRKLLNSSRFFANAEYLKYLAP